MTRRSVKQKIGTWVILNFSITKETLDILRLEINAFVVRLNIFFNPVKRRRIKNFISQNEVSVNIGAGPFGMDGWVNLDLYKHKNITFTYDCRRKLPFKDNSVLRIRCEHFLEHLDRTEEAPLLLRECHRCLIPRGILRIVVPDLEKFINAYVKNDEEEWRKIGFILGGDESEWKWPIEILNHTFRQKGEHKFGYDYKTLEADLLAAGFSTILKLNWNETNDPMLKNDLENHRPYSLYVEAVK